MKEKNSEIEFFFDAPTSNWDINEQSMSELKDQRTKMDPPPKKS